MQLNTNFMQLCATLDIDVKRGQLTANSPVTWGLMSSEILNDESYHVGFRNGKTVTKKKKFILTFANMS